MLQSIKKLSVLALVICVISAVFSGTAVSYAAAAATTNLPQGFLIGDQDGVHVDEHGVYYIDCRGIEPGQVIHKTLTIQNLEQYDRTPEGSVPYALSMTAEPVMTSGPVDLLDTRVVMTLDGVTVYTGNLRGDGTPDMNRTALRLGVYGVGDRKTLDITMTVDPDMVLQEEISQADFKWIFYAYRTLDVDPPKTGLLETYWGLLIPIGLTAMLFTFLVLKKRKQQNLLN
jgi:hypothetical protein